MEGYSYLAEIDHAVTDSVQAFVAMWFGESMDEVWEKGSGQRLEKQATKHCGSIEKNT